MRSFISIAILLFTIQLSYADDVVPKKTCKDFFPESTCESLQNLVKTLKETSSTVQDAINAGIQQHIQTSKALLAFIKGYIAERIQCETIFSQDKCTVLYAVAQRLKLTKQQVQMAIEIAVSGTKATARQVFQKVLQVLKGDIDCATILGQKACQNMESALDKFHEQRSLLKEAILSVALKHYQNSKDFLNMVQVELTERIKNFNCATVLTDNVCNKLVSIAQQLKILPSKVREAIELAIMNGVTQAAAIYNFAIEFLTNQITCENILSSTACTNLVEATKKLKEQSRLIKEALMEAAIQKKTDVTDILKFVRDKVIEGVQNFKCTDVIPQLQCDFLVKLATRFQIRKDKLTRIIVGAIVNGTRTAILIYDATINALIEEAKDLKCEEMIDVNLCQILNAFAKNLHENVKDVADAVRRALAAGKSTITEIRSFVKTLLVDEKSCRDLFKSYFLCKSIRIAGYIKGITFDRIIAKMRELYANGVTTANAIGIKIKEIIDQFNPLTKRSADITDIFTKNKNEMVDLVMQIAGGLVKISEKVKASIKAELGRLYDSGKLRLSNIRQTIKDLIKKYNPLSDEFEDEVPADLQDVSSIYKAARKALERGIRAIVEAAKRMHLKSEELMKMIQEMYKSAVAELDENIIASL